MRKTVHSACPFAFALKLGKPPPKKENVPRACPVPLCTAALWLLNIKQHLARCHATLQLDSIDLKDWKVATQQTEKKVRGKKIPSVLRPSITLKVAQVAGSNTTCEVTSFSEASMGRSDAEWKLEDSELSTDNSDTSDTSSSDVDSDYAGTSSSSTATSSDSSSFAGVEVVGKKKTVPKNKARMPASKRPLPSPKVGVKRQRTAKQAKAQ